MVPPDRLGQSWTLEIAASDISADLSYLYLGLLLKIEGKVKGKGAWRFRSFIGCISITF